MKRTLLLIMIYLLLSNISFSQTQEDKFYGKKGVDGVTAFYKDKAITKTDYQTLKGGWTRMRNAGVFAINDRQKLAIEHVLVKYQVPSWWKTDGTERNSKEVFFEFFPALKDSIEKQQEAFIRNLIDRTNAIGMQFRAGGPPKDNPIFKAQQKQIEQMERKNRSEEKHSPTIKTFGATIVPQDSKKRTLEDFIQAKDASQAKTMLGKKWSPQGYNVRSVYEVR